MFCTHQANKQLHKLGRRGGEKRNASLPGGCLGQERLARPWRPNEEDSPRHAGPERLEAVRVLERLNNLHELILCGRVLHQPCPQP